MFIVRYNPFNPQLPARPQIFVGREPEISQFERFLSQTNHGSPMNMSITGNRGMGKTSLLNKFEDLARTNQSMVLRLSNYEGNVNCIVELADYITTNLKREILVRKPLGSEYERIKQFAASIKPTISFSDISLSIERNQIVQELFRTRMLKLWEEMKCQYGSCVILFDEAESLEKIEGALIFLREVFQRIAVEANYMVVLAGKLNFPERMSESFSPLNRFFPCSGLTPFSLDESEAYISKQLADVGVSIDIDALSLIALRAEGHPYVLVATCYMIFDGLGSTNRISMETIKKLEEPVFSRLAQDFFAPMYHPLTPGAKKVIGKIAANAGTDIFYFRDSVKWMKTKSSNVSPYINELMRKGVINKLERGKYQIFHGLFVEYVNKVTVVMAD